MKDSIKDKYGRKWNLPESELCPECKQPDTEGECNHNPLSSEEVIMLGGSLNYKVTDIKYDTDGEDISLPEELEINVPSDLDGYEVEEFISDEISNITGFCHKGFTTSPEIEY